MKRTVALSVWLVAIIIGMITGLVFFALSSPAQADHTVEPSAPITGIELGLSHYGTGTPIVCGGVASSTFRNLRIDPIVIVSDRPSEHWTAKLTMQSQINRGANWYLEWEHQNVPPHARSLRWVGGQGSQSLQAGADYTVTWEVWGDASGAYFSETCSFTIGS